MDDDTFITRLPTNNGGLLQLYTAGGHVGPCETFDEKIAKLSHTASNGVFLIYYPDSSNKFEFRVLERFFLNKLKFLFSIISKQS